MQNIVVTGGAGFLGSQLIDTLLRVGRHSAVAHFDKIISVDLVPCPIDDSRLQSVTGNIAEPGFVRHLISKDTVAVYHMAAVLSGQSEAEFDTGMRINVDGTRALLEAARLTDRVPRFIFVSSLAVFGGPLPDVIPEKFALMPRSSYGAQKAIGELLVGDYTRKGYLDGRVCRLPTIVVRPGTPNSAASSFASSIIREPLAGIAANNPVPPDTRMWLSSPGQVIRNLLHAAAVDAADLGDNRVINMPGISITVAEMLDSLERVAGTKARALVTARPDQRVADIVCSWPGAFDIARALELGFSRDVDFDSNIRQYRDKFSPQHPALCSTEGERT